GANRDLFLGQGLLGLLLYLDEGPADVVRGGLHVVLVGPGALNDVGDDLAGRHLAGQHGRLETFGHIRQRARGVAFAATALAHARTMLVAVGPAGAGPADARAGHAFATARAILAVL